MGRADLRSQIEALHPHAWKWFVARREVYKAQQYPPADAANSAFEDTVQHFSKGDKPPAGLEAPTVVYAPQKPSLTHPQRGMNESPGAVPVPEPKAVGNMQLWPKSAFASTAPLPTNRVIAWVSSMLYVDDVQPGDAPNSDAWGWLMWCRESPANRGEFFRSVAPKLIPTKTQLEHEAKRSDDGRELTATIERVRRAREAAVLQAGSEGIRCEPDVSRADS